MANITDKYKNKYRIPTNRLRGYDYSTNGCYFVTICTKNREHYFGEIVIETNIESPQHTLQPTQIGEIAGKFWSDIPNHFPFVVLDQFMVMPNHIHGILLFNKTAISWQANKFGSQSQNLGSVIRGFKSSLKRYADENNIIFAWQERFYDNIIHDNNSLDRVREYISKNPQNWNGDELNGKNKNAKLIYS